MPFNSLAAQVPAAKKAVPTNTKVTASATAVLLVNSNSGRVGLDLINESSSICYVKYTAVATPATAAAHDLVIPPSTHYEFPGLPPDTAINAIWASANGFMTIVEWKES